MVLREHKRTNEENIKEPIEPDDGWWAAVLADEQKIEQGAEVLDLEFLREKKQTDLNVSGIRVNWEKVKSIFSQDNIITLCVVGHNRGGILVEGEDIHGFVPASHLIDVPADLAEDEREAHLMIYLDREISLKIIECDPDKERIVFSERAALAKEGQRKHLLYHLMPGDVVKGLVTNVTSFGAFVDLGGLEGLIHVSELSWGRVNHPSDVINVGDDVEVVVLQISEDQGRIALSLKRLQENPWERVSKSIKPGDLLEAVITSIVQYGAFARLEEGIEGLIHISSITFPEGCSHLDEFLYEGQQVQVCALHIDPEKRRLGLKLESCTD